MDEIQKSILSTLALHSAESVRGLPLSKLYKNLHKKGGVQAISFSRFLKCVKGLVKTTCCKIIYLYTFFTKKLATALR